MSARKVTEEQKAKAKERRERFRGLWKQVANMPDLERIQLANKLGIVTAEGHPLSPRNQCILALQIPAVSVVAGFRQWIRAGRCVKKGEHGAMIWIPTFKKPGETKDEAPETEQEEHRFIIGTVFDISQTCELGQEQEESDPCEGRTIWNSDGKDGKPCLICPPPKAEPEPEPEPQPDFRAVAQRQFAETAALKFS